MINRGIINLILGGFFYTLIIFSFLTRYNNIVVYAKENIIDMVDNRYISFVEEDEQNTSNVLYDYKESIVPVNDEVEDSENYTEDMSDNNTDSIEEDMTDNDKFHIMIIFCFGLCAGVIVGHFLTGFIK